MIAVPAGDLTEMVGQYVTEKTGMRLDPGMYQAFMVVSDQQEFIAGVVISNFRETDCELSAASESATAWRPHVCKAVFSYVFEQLGCVRCTSITVKGNRKARSFLESLGFQLEGNLRLGYDGRRDALIYGLLRSECRYLNEATDGQEIRSSSTSTAGPVQDGGRAEPVQQGSGDLAGEPEPDQSVHAGREPDLFF